MRKQTDCRALLADYADGTIDQVQLKELETALRENAELRREFIEYMNLDSALSDLASLSDAEIDEFELDDVASVDILKPCSCFSDLTANTEEAFSEQNSTPWRIRRPVRFAATAALLTASLLCALTLWVLNNSGKNDHQTVGTSVATLVTKVDATLTKDGQICTGADLSVGRYQLEGGLLNLQFAGEVMVYVEAPARFEVVSAKRVVLHSGCLSATVPPEGIGFTVETPEAEVIDFGTEFSVEAAFGKSEVHVFNGRVRVQPKSTRDGKESAAIDLQTSQAVKVEAVTNTPEDIELDNDRFIRSFDEPQITYPYQVNALSPVAYYRMPILAHGLVCEPPRYSGDIMTGEGERPTQALGFIGGSLRVTNGSIGRGARVTKAPPLSTGQFTMVVFIFGGTRQIENCSVATNIHGNAGNFALSLNNPSNRLQATIRTSDGELKSCVGDVLELPFARWLQVVMTVDGEKLCLYEEGELVASTECSAMAPSLADTIWIGTDATGTSLWRGRIDELAFYDRALSAEEVAMLYHVSRDHATPHEDTE